MCLHFLFLKNVTLDYNLKTFSKKRLFKVASLYFLT